MKKIGVKSGLLIICRIKIHHIIGFSKSVRSVLCAVVCIILVEYFYGDGSPLFLSQRQMTSTPQNLIKNIIFMPQFLPGDVKMAPGNVKMLQATSNSKIGGAEILRS